MRSWEQDNTSCSLLSLGEASVPPAPVVHIAMPLGLEALVEEDQPFRGAVSTGTTSPRAPLEIAPPVPPVDPCSRRVPVPAPASGVVRCWRRLAQRGLGPRLLDLDLLDLDRGCCCPCWRRLGPRLLDLDLLDLDFRGCCCWRRRLLGLERRLLLLRLLLLASAASASAPTPAAVHLVIVAPSRIGGHKKDEDEKIPKCDHPTSLTQSLQRSVRCRPWMNSR